MASGKSTAGKALAGKLEIPFLDLDTEIEQKESLTIREIFSKYGEIRFRKIENQILREILDKSGNYVLALGGGTPAYFNNMEIIKNRATSIYLRANPNSIIQNLKSDKMIRPLIAHLSDEQLPEFIAKHLFERSYFYEQADFQVNTQNKSIEKIVSEIIQLLHPEK
jgi:shikimate kinase